MPSPIPGWLESRLSDGLTVLAREDGAGRPVYVRRWGYRVKFVVYEGDGRETEFRKLAEACQYAAA